MSGEIMQYRFLHKGEWEKQRKSIMYMENRCFKKSEQTYQSIFKELIDDIEPFMLIMRDGRVPVGYFMCAGLEDSGTDLKKWDKNFGKHNTLYVFSICVIPKYRNAGIGHYLMKIMLREAHKQYDRISLHTQNKEFESLCRYYGFRRVKEGRLDGHKASYMVKWLR